MQSIFHLAWLWLPKTQVTVKCTNCLHFFRQFDYYPPTTLVFFGQCNVWSILLEIQMVILAWARCAPLDSCGVPMDQTKPKGYNMAGLDFRGLWSKIWNMFPNIWSISLVTTLTVLTWTLLGTQFPKDLVSVPNLSLGPVSVSNHGLQLQNLGCLPRICPTHYTVYLCPNPRGLLSQQTATNDQQPTISMTASKPHT